MAETEYRRGDWDAGATLAEQAVTLVQDTEQVWLLAFAHAVAVFVPAAQGRWEQAEAHLAACRQAARTLGDQPSRAYADNAAVHLSLCRGDAAGVVAAARDLLGDPPGGSHDSGIFSWATHHATALVELGCLDEAAVALDSLTSAARQGQHGPRLARLARVRGQLAAARRQPDQARAAFNEALRLGEGTVDALEAAMSHAAYGRFLRRRGERRAAVEQLTHAESLLTTLQAEPFLRRCRAELTACGHPVGPHAPVTHHVGVETLTPQELAVANLVCAGQTNREAAQELVLSVKTIGYHLGHVYAKLGVRSRTELVARLGGTPGPHGT